MNFLCIKCRKPVFIKRPENEPLPLEQQTCYNCEKEIQRKEIKTGLGYSRIGLRNV